MTSPACLKLLPLVMRERGVRRLCKEAKKPLLTEKVPSLFCDRAADAASIALVGSSRGRSLALIMLAPIDSEQSPLTPTFYSKQSSPFLKRQREPKASLVLGFRDNLASLLLFLLTSLSP